VVRRDVDETRDVRDGSACCASLVGESPTPVSVGAPGSRVAASGEILGVEADRRKPLRGEQPYLVASQAHRASGVGPQHEVKPAASSEEQSGSRAAHLTAKAISGALVPKRASGPGGVRGAALTEREVRNTRGPSSRPPSRRAASISQRVKGCRAERESEGIVVVEIRAQQNARGAKGPCFGRVG
jgi:hypothetical protein